MLAHTAALALAISAVGCTASSSCGPAEAMVTRVIDGDTIELAGGTKIRYLLVDAPEITNGHDDCYGANAAQFNSDLVLGKWVQLRYAEDCTDRFDRTLAYVSVDGQEVNTRLVERGYACVLHIPPDGDDRVGEITRLETEARDARRGLWGACNPIPCK